MLRQRKQEQSQIIFAHSSWGRLAAHLQWRSILLLNVVELKAASSLKSSQDELATCPNCGTLFKPRRKDMKFCKANCRKAFSKPTQNSLHSPTTARKNMELFQLARQMADVLYSLPPNRRLGHLQELISEAREGNTKLR